MKSIIINFIVLMSLIVFFSGVALGEDAQEPSPDVQKPIVIIYKEKTDNEEEVIYKSKFSVPDADDTLQKYDLSVVEIAGKVDENNQDKIAWNKLKRLDKEDKEYVLSEPFLTDILPNNSENKLKGRTDIQLLELALRFLFMTQEELDDYIKKIAEEDRVSIPGISNITNSGLTGSEGNPYDASAIGINSETVDYRQEVCPIRIDWENNQVFEQAEVIKSINGTDVDRQGCQDSSMAIEILNTYLECSDDVELSSNTVYKMYKPYYLNNGGEQVYLKECQRDENKSYEIKESLMCTPMIDMEHKVVKELSYLYYKDDTDQTVTVSECQERETTRQFDVEYTYDTCTYRVDAGENVAYQQGKFYYVKDEVATDITICQDSDLIYPIEKEFCEYKENWQANTVVKYEKDKINTINGLVYLTDCLPTVTTDIIETVDGCEKLHTDYFEGGYSKAHSRFYYKNTESKRVYLTSCQESSVVIPHQARIMDWVADFSKNQAVSQVAYFIDLNGKEVQISEATETKDSIRVPLALQKSEVVETGNATFDGCTRSAELKRIDTYLLPSNKTVIKETILDERNVSQNCILETKTASVQSIGDKTTRRVLMSIKVSSFIKYTDTYSITLKKNPDSGEVLEVNYTLQSSTETKGSCYHPGKGKSSTMIPCPNSPEWNLSTMCGSRYYFPDKANCSNGKVVPKI